MRNLESLPSTTEFIQPISQGGLEIGLNHPRNGLMTSVRLPLFEKPKLYGVGFDASIPLSKRGDPKDPWKDVLDNMEARANEKRIKVMHPEKPLQLNRQ